MTGDNTHKTPNSKTLDMKIIAAASLCAIGILGSLILKMSGVISEPSLVTLIVFSVLVGLFIAYSHRVVKLGVASIELAKVVETEQSIKTIAWALLDVIEKMFEHTRVLESFDQNVFDESVAKLKSLIS